MISSAIRQHLRSIEGTISRVTIVAAGLTVAVTLSVAPALAQQTYPPQVEEQCRGDYFTFCSPYALGSNELRRCMEAKRDNLSPNCRQALKDAGYGKSRRSSRKY